VVAAKWQGLPVPRGMTVPLFFLGHWLTPAHATSGADAELSCCLTCGANGLSRLSG